MEDNTHGLGSLLNQAVNLADEHLKPDIDIVTLPTGEQVPFVLGHSGDSTTHEVIDPSDVEPWLKSPLHRRANPVLTSVESLIAYLQRFKDDGSIVFARDDRAEPMLHAVIDYHSPGPVVDGGQRFGRHLATFPMPLSDEWKAWNQYNGKTLQMQEFARFLEDHIIDVMDPGSAQFSAEQDRFVAALGGVKRMADPAKLMELATGLQVFEESQVKQAHRIQTGESQIRIENAHKDGEGNDLVVPSMFVIAIPVFKGGEPYQIVVRLRYRKAGGILFFYDLWREDKVFDHAFEEVCQQVQDGTSLLLLRGTK